MEVSQIRIDVRALCKEENTAGEDNFELRQLRSSIADLDGQIHLLARAKRTLQDRV